MLVSGSRTVYFTLLLTPWWTSNGYPKNTIVRRLFSGYYLLVDNDVVNTVTLELIGCPLHKIIHSNPRKHCKLCISAVAKAFRLLPYDTHWNSRI